ncbi:MAG: tRNA (adenosine(37)-N6)-threonylcarbamoyltransferase complex ATPase subunit type 1 TsaE [Thermoguttaceae bacterium]|jgi:tRNA threonylcarbamoyladenosine biosynthesis protein TsaE|nr:tRNA (adenosine(37)-N6)-threonylcarbamoyltransferase complex ATPase subunit type 1 TsaE [Thermoguttaceae bacterium]
MTSFTYHASDESGTAALGHALAELLPDGTVVALCGTLGAGKTRLVQAVAEGCGLDPRDVVSPTFVLIHEHHGRRDLYHFDAYRIRDDDEFEALGPEEYFESNGLTLVEWADRVADCLPAERLDVRIEVTGQRSRRFEIAARGERYAAVVRRLAEHLGARAATPTGPENRSLGE